MEDEKPEELEDVEELEVDDLDVEEAEAEKVKGGSGGDYTNSTFGNIKRGL